MTPLALLTKLLRALDVNLRFILAPLLLALGAALLEGISTGLLIPLLRGLVEADFTFLWSSGAGRKAIQIFPQLQNFSTLETFVAVLGLIFLASLLRITLSFFSDLLSAKRMRELAHRMRTHLFSQIITYGKGFFDQNKQGELHNIIVGFTHHMCNRLQRAHVQIRWMMLLLIYGALMLFISWKLTLATLIMLPLYHYPVSWVVKRIGKSSKEHAAADSFISSTLHGILSCISLVKVSGMEKKEQESFREKSLRTAELEYAVDKQVYLIAPIHEIVSLLLIMLLTICIAYIVVNNPGEDISAYLVFLYLLKRAATAFGTVADLRGILASLQGQLQDMDRLLSPRDKSIVPDGTKIFDGLEKSIAIRDLSFSYTPEKPILRNATLELKKGEVTALVGPSGGGKSTISNLLLRFYDCPAGHIFIDDVDIRDFDIHSLLDKVAYVSQDTHLFHDTFRNNICYGLKKDPTEEALQTAIRSARLEEVIKRLPEGMHSLIGDRGVQLSGGEKQRLSIARALLRNPQLLFLDEATSALDADTERLVQEALDELIVGKTVLVIAHRFSTIRGANTIYTIEDGQVAESGTFDQLTKAGGTFAQLWNAQ